MQYFNGYYFPNEIFIRKTNEKRELRYIGNIVGGAILLYVVLQELLALTVFIEDVAYAYMTNVAFVFLFSIIASVIGLFLPFLLAGQFLKRRTGRDYECFGKPVSYPLMFSVIFFGFFICLISNFVTDIFVGYMDAFGIELTSPEFEMPKDAFSRTVYAVAVSVVPALIEEFAFRGAVMQPLRKYGDGFAIVVSSVVFAILHGNLIQAPFALIAGFGMGYAACITNSIWTSVIIHFLNNFYSVAMSFLVSDVTNEELLNKIYLLSMVILYAISIMGSVVFIVIKRRRKLAGTFSVLTQGEKYGAVFVNVPMIISFLIMLIQIANYVDFAE